MIPGLLDSIITMVAAVVAVAGIEEGRLDEVVVMKTDELMLIVVETVKKDVTVVEIGIKMKKEEKKDEEVVLDQEVENETAAIGAGVGAEKEREVEREAKSIGNAEDGIMTEIGLVAVESLYVICYSLLHSYFNEEKFLQSEPMAVNFSYARQRKVLD